jgi:hypothetical protein
MKIKEVCGQINEWIQMDDTPFVMPPHRGSKKVGAIDIKLGKYEVRRLDKPNYSYFFVIDKTTKKPIAFTLLKMMNAPYGMPRNAYSTIKNQGIMTALFHFIVREQGIKLLSDFEMTRDGEKLWRSIIARRLLNVSIIDLIGGEQYSFDDVGLSKTTDGEIVRLPEKDDRPIPTNITGDNADKKQRFMYLAEKFECAKTLLEDADPRVDPFGINKWQYVKKLEQPYIYFYEPMP